MNGRNSTRFGFRSIQPYMLIISGLLFLGCQKEPLSPEALIKDAQKFYGRTVRIRTSLHAELRCRLKTQEGKWMTYCGDCQICRGPLVAELTTQTATTSWPLVLAGSWKGKPIQCEGPINRIECYPFSQGKTYLITGLLEKATPPRLYINDFEEIP